MLGLLLKPRPGSGDLTAQHFHGKLWTLGTTRCTVTKDVSKFITEFYSMFEHVQNVFRAMFYQREKNIQSDGCTDNLVTLSSWRLSHFRLCSNVRIGKGHAGHAGHAAHVSTMFQ